MKTFYRKNDENRITTMMTSYNDVEEGYIEASELKGADGRDLMFALVDDDNNVTFDEAYDNAHKPPPPPPPPPLTQDQAVQIIQAKLDEKAREYNFDSIFTAGTYLNSAVEKFKTDATALITWRDQVWVWAYDLQDKINKGEIPAPTSSDELLSTMPEFVPPA